MEFRVLGPVGAHAGGRRVAPVGARQERVLAALLLDAGRVVPVSRLVDVIWGDDPPATATRQVRNVTTGLRRALVAAGLPPDALTAVGPGFVLHPPRFDLRDFEAHAERGDHAAALACWRGRALEGVDALAGAAAALEERRLAVRLLHYADEVAAGRDVVADLTALVAEHPLAEGFAALLVRALRHRGRQAEALEVYRAARRRLVDELGVEPGAELRAAHDEALREPSGPCCLPGEVPDFVGRDGELAEVVAALHRGVPVVVSGMPGVGKTALAVRAAHRVAEAYVDGQLFVDLHGYTPGRDRLDAAAALAGLLWQVGVPASHQPPDLDARAALWRARTAGRKLLVLLDNAADAAQVVPLIPATPTVAVVVTSRRRLALDGAAPVPLDPLPAAESSALFTAVSGRPDAGVARLCGDLPLAVRIAAARLRQRPQWTVEDLAARLGGERDRLAELRAGGRDVAAALHLSYRELEPAQQRVFRLLGAHPGPVTAPAAAALSDLPTPVAERLLEDLVDAHLLDPADTHAYRMHDLLAEHARGLADPEATAGFTRLLDYYRAGGDARWYATERAALPAIVERALERRHDEAAWQVADRAAPHLRGPEALGIAEAATRAARRTGDPAALHRALGHLADAHWDRGDLSAALACTRSRFRLTAAPPDRASALSRLGSLHAMSGRYRASITCYRRALTLTEDEDDLTGRVLANLSHSLEVLGDLRTALRSARRSREIAASTGNRVHAVLSTAQEALVLARTGDHRAAERLALDAVHDADDLDFALAWAHTDSAEVMLITGKPALARAHAERACAVLERTHHPLLFTMAANTYGTACLRTDDPAAALAQHRIARATAERTGYLVQAERAARGIALAGAALSA